ncbi:MAG: nuclear transport factor 2 family protein [Bacteroidetes bacterium]|nr:nuclear transport factor 2 family protein [Bacteroidota bacterium]
MQIPPIIEKLISAQNKLDSHAFTACFAAEATVVDEGRTYQGTAEIEPWIAAANQKYNSHMKALDYLENEGRDTLITEVSGTFPGSPIVLRYNFELRDGLIRSLRVSS